MSDIRNSNNIYEYYIKNTEYTGTILCYIDNDNIDILKFYNNTSISEIKDSVKDKVVYTENVFLIISSIVLVIFLINIDTDDDFDDV